MIRTDLEIQKNIIDEFKYEPFLDETEVGVSVTDGVVTLSGTVDSYLKKITAEKAAKRVSGVKVVAEDIEVKYPNSLIKNDTEIAKAVLDSLKWNVAVDEEKIKVKVENGIVTLEGEVEWEFQKKSAQAQVENLQGVKAIVNKVVLKSSVFPKDIKTKIIQAFHRNATIDADRIIIESVGHKVILNGTVRSLAERDDAESAVWLAPGVEKVENNLKIEHEVFV